MLWWRSLLLDLPSSSPPEPIMSSSPSCVSQAKAAIGLLAGIRRSKQAASEEAAVYAAPTPVFVSCVNVSECRVLGSTNMMCRHIVFVQWLSTGYIPMSYLR